MAIKLQQGQVWKLGEHVFVRLVRVERLAVHYREQPSPNSRQGTHHHLSKKEFCRFIKGSTLLTDQEIFLSPPR